jgi:hypothetical protein
MPGRLVFSTTADGAFIPTERMRIKSSGDMLIGDYVAGGLSATTGIDLMLSAVDDPLMAIVDNGEGALLLGVYNGNGFIGRDGFGPLEFKTGCTFNSASSGTTRMTLDSSGNVGIGLIPTSRNNTRLQIVDGIGFPATQVASSDANTLDDYREATFTATATGMTTAPTGTVAFVRVGNAVTITIPAITGTSNATSFTLTGGPTTMRPSAARIIPVRVQDNGGAITWGMASIGTDGVITLSKDAAAGAFTASGTKSIAISSASYSI